jgi:hypothetical protein
MKTPVVYNKDYVVYLEFFDGNTFFHCDCSNWNRKVRKALQKDMDTLAALHKKTILAITDIEDNKKRKFLNLMKFEYHSDVACTDGKIRQIFTRGL